MPSAAVEGKGREELGTYLCSEKKVVHVEFVVAPLLRRVIPTRVRGVDEATLAGPRPKAL